MTLEEEGVEAEVLSEVVVLEGVAGVEEEGKAEASTEIDRDLCKFRSMTKHCHTHMLT